MGILLHRQAPMATTTQVSLSSKVIDITVRSRQKAALERLESIPTPPLALNEIIKLLNDADSSVLRLEELILSEPGIAAMVIKVVNSPVYYPVHPIETISRAIMFLGFDEIKKIAMKVGVLSPFKQKDIVQELSMIANHSIATAMITAMLSEQISQNNYGEDRSLAYLVGLVHDIGRMAIVTCFTDNWKKIRYKAKSENISLFAAEKSFLFNHTLIGNWLADRWQLPGNIKNAVANHHAPLNDSATTPLSAAVQLADYLSYKLGLDEHTAPDINEEAFVLYLGIPAGFLDYMKSQLGAIKKLSSDMAKTML